MTHLSDMILALGFHAAISRISKHWHAQLPEQQDIEQVIEEAYREWRENG